MLHTTAPVDGSDSVGHPRPTANPALTNKMKDSLARVFREASQDTRVPSPESITVSLKKNMVEVLAPWFGLSGCILKGWVSVCARIEKQGLDKDEVVCIIKRLKQEDEKTVSKPRMSNC